MTLEIPMIPMIGLTPAKWIIGVRQILGIPPCTSAGAVVEPGYEVGMTWMTSFIGLILVISLLGSIRICHLVLDTGTIWLNLVCRIAKEVHRVAGAQPGQGGRLS